MRLTEAPVLPPLPPQEYAQLRDSIRERGVLQPILITTDHLIIDGHERWKAIRELGLATYPLRIMSNLSDAERKELAIRLNVERRHLSRAERQRLLEMILKESPSKSTREVADLLKIGKSTVSRARQVVGAGVPGGTPATISGRDGKFYPYRHPTVAVETPSQAQEATDLLNRLGDDAPEGASNLRKLRTIAAQQRREQIEGDPISKLPARIRIKHCSYQDLNLKPNTVSLILTDPPWGHDKTTLDLWDGLGVLAKRVLTPGGLLVTYAGQAGLPTWLGILGRHLTYRWIFICANEAGHSIAPTRGSFGLMNGYRSLLLFSKGEFRPYLTVKDIIITAGCEKHLHRWQQPLSEAQYYVERLCAPGGLVCDPFCGSGTTAIAVLRAGGGRRYLGCDVSKEAVRIARSRATSSEAEPQASGSGPAA
jgi:ParB-like chromosome segregation protein Spo0J